MSDMRHEKIRETAARHGLRELTLRRLIYRHELPVGVYARVGRRYLIFSQRFDEWLAAGGCAAIGG